VKQRDYQAIRILITHQPRKGLVLAEIHSDDMRYPVNLQSDTGGFVVSFPDIPEALTQGDDREGALAMGLDALVTAFDFYFEDNRKVP